MSNEERVNKEQLQKMSKIGETYLKRVKLTKYFTEYNDFKIIAINSLESSAENVHLTGVTEAYLHQYTNYDECDKLKDLRKDLIKKK